MIYISGMTFLVLRSGTAADRLSTPPSGSSTTQWHFAVFSAFYAVRMSIYSKACYAKMQVD